ncbi:hypothetical protein FKW77_001863 [Venturia effusa]|uniref:Uncharacterized protein n=1 Tax=Venturia effusa TaxID=50376 RepID=A0A517L8R0_9PEZI|nr:hypothetical protein FKW77_001863 [Venturia effusa]
MSKRKSSEVDIDGPSYKRGKQDNPTNNTVQVATATPSHKPRTSFLTLPPELRQKILYLSCDLGISIGDKYRGSHIRLLEYLEWISDCRAYMEHRNTRLRAEILRGIHELIDQDMVFVLAKWKREVEELEAVCIEENREMIFRREF